LQGLSLATAAAIVAHGHVALFIDGDIDASAFFSLTLDPTSTFDVFVSGTMRGSAMIKIGSANYPALTRVYFGGTSTLTLTSTTIIAANLYDATAKIDWTSDTDMFGSLFAGDFETTAPLAIHYDREVVKSGGECPPPPTTSSDAGSSPDTSVAFVCGAPAVTCGSCRDCGNQACTGGTCGNCATSADCCAPLVCQGGCCVSPIK